MQVPHYNYVGDSILGYKSHMGAGSITSNVKSDKSLVVIHNGDERIETGRKKIGTILGDCVEVGCNSVLNPGTIIGRNSNVYPMSCVRGVVQENGMDVKTLSAMLGHVSAATTLDIYTHITDDMRLTAAANIDRGIGKAAPQEDSLHGRGRKLPQPQRKSRERPISNPTWAASASPAPAVSPKSTTISSRGAILPNGPTAKSTPAMSTHTPVRNVRRS